jgi:predicted regulator of Ras-like GTPase activity (Roadblock/LC7/MglB family)
VDAAQALADLTEISSQIEAVVVSDSTGAILASTLEQETSAQRVAEGAARLLDEAAAVAARESGELAQVEAATPEGSVFVVRDGGRTIAATTGPEPTVGLVFYDLKSCLRSLDEPTPTPKPKPKPAPKSAPRRKKEPADGPA